jgi:superfamily II helicase
MIKYAPERERVLDELVVAYDELAGERLDGLITQEVYLKRKLQLNYIAIDAGIGSPEIEREIAKRYRRQGEGE